jgi:hypothetical protein
MNSNKKYFSSLLTAGLSMLSCILKAQSDHTDVMIAHPADTTHPKYEVHLSIDKTNPSNLILSANTQVGGSAPTQQGVYYSNSGGASWSNTSGTTDSYPGAGSTVDGDPSTAYDGSGNCYVSTLMPNRGGIYVAKSTNKGLTFATPVQACGPSLTGYCGYNPNSNRVDKQMIAADNAVNSSFINNIYAVWSEFTTNGNCSPTETGFIGFCRSIDGASTFSSPIALRDDLGLGQGANVQTGPNGEVYVCWADYGSPTSFPANNIGFAYSNNGGVNFSTTPSFTTKAAFSYNGTRDAAQEGVFNMIEMNDFPSMAVDKGCSPYRGRIYVAYPENICGNGCMQSVIKLMYSDNHGIAGSWQPCSTQVSIHADQSFFPWITVDDLTGAVCIAYYAFDSTNTYITNTYVAYSLDGGSTFTNVKVSDVSHITAPIPGFGANSQYAGDYIGITAYNGKAYASWMDNRTGSTMADWQVYVSEMDFPYTYLYTTTPNNLNVNGPITISNGGSANYMAVNEVVIPASSTFQSQSVSNVTIHACLVDLASNFSASNELWAYANCSTPTCVTTGSVGRSSNGSSTGTIEGIAGISKDGNNAIKIYPNPTNGILYLNINAIQRCKVQVSLSDISGKELLHSSSAIEAGSNEVKIDIHDYKPGMYLISVSDETGNMLRRDKIVLSK